MARLFDAGKLDLDAPITRYVPSFADKGAITARQLAGHRAGIRHYRDDEEAFTTRHFATVTESLELFRDDSLLFPPGQGHEYSSYGYALLGAALEGASRLPFGEVIRHYVSEPLQLTRTGLDTSDSTSARPAGVTGFYDHVTPYVRDGQVHPSPFVDMSSKWAGGGMLSTSEDLVRFGSALLPNAERPFLHPGTRDALFTPMTRLVPPIFGYAMGWMTARDAELRRLYMHFGAGSGATAWLGIYPDQRVVIAVLANLGHAGLPYASSVGLGAHFAARPIGPTVLVLGLALVASGLATIILRWIVHQARARWRRA
jgi:CubicO group peptidase (beta-lactamase class C family)